MQSGEAGSVRVLESQYLRGKHLIYKQNFKVIHMISLPTSLTPYLITGAYYKSKFSVQY